jgi:hypothetical protein
VASFANTAGGHILYGISEERDGAGQATGIPQACVGITANVDAEVLRLESSARDGIDPRIAGIRWRAVPIASGAPVLVCCRLRLVYHAASDEFQRAVGVPEALLEALEQAEQPFREDRYSRRDVLEVPSSGDLEAEATAGLEALSSLVDPEWLREEGRKPYRLDDRYLAAPLHLVGGLRTRKPSERPQRFAQMLFTDHLDKRSELDFFAAPLW